MSHPKGGQRSKSIYAQVDLFICIRHIIRKCWMRIPVPCRAYIKIHPHPPLRKEGISLPSFSKRGRGRLLPASCLSNNIFSKLNLSVKHFWVSLVKPVAYLSWVIFGTQELQKIKMFLISWVPACEELDSAEFIEVSRADSQFLVEHRELLSVLCGFMSSQ